MKQYGILSGILLVISFYAQAMDTYKGKTITMCGRLGQQDEWVLTMSQGVGYMSKTIKRKHEKLGEPVDCRGKMLDKDKFRFEYKGPCADWLNADRATQLFEMFESEDKINNIKKEFKKFGVEEWLRKVEVLHYLNINDYSTKEMNSTGMICEVLRFLHSDFSYKMKESSMVKDDTKIQKKIIKPFVKKRLDTDHLYITDNASPDIMKLIVTRGLVQYGITQKMNKILNITQGDFVFKNNIYSRENADELLEILKTGNGLTTCDVISLNKLMKDFSLYKTFLSLFPFGRMVFVRMVVEQLPQVMKNVLSYKQRFLTLDSFIGIAQVIAIIYVVYYSKK